MAGISTQHLQLAERAPAGVGPPNAEAEEEKETNAIVEFFSVLYEEGVCSGSRQSS
jgi:hypothetical protein